MLRILTPPTLLRLSSATRLQPLVAGFQKVFQGPERHLQTDTALGRNAEPAAKEQSRVKEYSEIPGPKPWPIVGNTIQIMMHPEFNVTQMHKMWKSLFDEYGPIIKLTMIGRPDMVMTLNPADIEVFMKSTMHNPLRDAFQSLKKIRDNAHNNYFNKKAGLLPENGDEWWRLRSRVQVPLLRPKNVAMYLPQVDRASLKLLDRIELLQQEHGRVPDHFLQDLYKWALESVALVALDRELGCLDPGLTKDSTPMQIIRLTTDMFSALNDTEMGMQTWRLYRSAAFVKLETAHNKLLQIVDKMIQETAAILEANKAKGDQQGPLTVMETFLNTDGLSKSDMATMIMDMIFAGIDTTSHTIAFTLYLLSKNPDCQRKLQEEVDRVMGDSKDLLPEHITQMVYLSHVLKESLRLYPLAIGVARPLIEEIVMSGYRVPAGTVAVGLNMLIGREEKSYTRADDFVPERWGRDRPHGVIHPFAALPFGHGKRMCIGKRIAEQEIYSLIIRLMQKYSVTFESNEEMDVITQLVLKPNISLAFKFHPRK